MKKEDLRDVLELVKDKITRDAINACGLLWADAVVTSWYAVGEEDATSDYSVGEEDATTAYAVGEED